MFKHSSRSKHRTGDRRGNMTVALYMGAYAHPKRVDEIPFAERVRNRWDAERYTKLERFGIIIRRFADYYRATDIKTGTVSYGRTRRDAAIAASTAISDRKLRFVQSARDRRIDELAKKIEARRKKT